MTTDSPLWDWSEVALWLFRHERVSGDVAVSAAVVSVANDLISRNEPDFRRTLRRKVEERFAF